MKQRVAVALATVWLASIVGASVPSGETTAFSTPRPPGPSPDQYTPLLRNPRYYPQDDYGQDWMNDEPPRIKVPNREESSDRGQTAITDSDSSLPTESLHNVEAGEAVDTPRNFQSKENKKLSELDREAMKLSSIKVAFDEPIDSELPDNTSEEDWYKEDLEKYDAMQQDEFVSDETFEDEGPGSVEMYNLDLYKDRSILSAKPPKDNYSKNKSKIPKKVEAIDQLVWKSIDQEDSKQNIKKKVSRIENLHSDEFPAPSRSSKAKIFGVGEVPELQVGCEGVEAYQREKRSDSKVKNSDQTKSPSIDGSQLYLDVEYDSEEYSDAVAGGDELLRILSTVSSTTDSSSNSKSRGDMDPRVKTPADLEAIRIRQKDKLPLRGDLGPSEDPNSTGTRKEHRIINPSENHSRLNSDDRLHSPEDEVAKSVRNKRSPDWGYGENEGVTNEGKRRVHRRVRLHGEKGTKRRQRRRRRHEGETERERTENEIRRRNKAIDKIREDYRKSQEDHIRQNRLSKVGGNQAANLLGQPTSRQDGRNQGYTRRDEENSEQEIRRTKEMRIRDDRERKLQDYIRRNTPIRSRQSGRDNQRRRQHQREKELRKHDSTNEAPQNQRLPVPPVNDNQGTDAYAKNRSLLAEQKQREVEHVNRAAYEKELRRLRDEERRRSTTERMQNRTEGERVYVPRSPEEIARLKALPVSAYIIIQQEKPKNDTPTIESRWNDNEITYPGLNPANNGRQVPDFPSPATKSPPVEGPSPCVWAIMTCCSNKNRLASCFETKGCYGGHWDSDPCSEQKISAALQMVNKFYGG